MCAAGWGSGVLAANNSQCVICTPGFYSPGGSDEPCSACSPGQTSTVAATSSGDCFDTFIDTAPYAFIDTPASAWTPVSFKVPANASADAAARCKAACQSDELCEYWAYREAQPDPQADGCFLKLAPTQPATDTYTSIKLATGDYQVFPVSATCRRQAAAEMLNDALLHALCCTWWRVHQAIVTCAASTT